MTRRIPELCLALACAFPALAGCEGLHHNLRRDSDATADASANAKEETPVHPEVKSDPPGGFFKSTRLSGAMSDEGRDIEKSLGLE